MKVICVDLNYKSHNKKLGETLLELDRDPVLFLKPDSSLLKDGKPFFIPDFSREIYGGVQLVVKINKLGKNIAERFAHRYYDEITLGVGFTAKDLQSKQQKHSQPWDISTSFDCSAVLGDFIPKAKIDNFVEGVDIKLMKDEECMQHANTSKMIHSIDALIAYASRFFTLKIGDLIYTGTPIGEAKIDINNHLRAYLNGQQVLNFLIK